MAHKGEIPLSYSLVAGADHSLDQHKAAARNVTTGETLLMASMEDFFAGILRGKPKLGEHATLELIGITKVIVGGAVTQNDYLTTGATSGFLFTAVSGDLTLGRCWETVASGGIATAQVFGGAFHAMTTSLS